jgi:hypothetical protein
MIKESTDDMLEADHVIFVNPVNCCKAYGKGLASLIFERYPGHVEPYKEACTLGSLTIGKGLLLNNDGQLIYHFPTKFHWKYNSKLRWIEYGLQDLATRLGWSGFEGSMGVPALGCGQGALKWLDVRTLIVDYLGELPIDLTVYPPRDDRRS